MSDDLEPESPAEEEFFGDAELAPPGAAPALSGAGLPPPPAVPQPHRPSVLYDPNSGKLDVKKLAAWLAAIAAFIASLSYLGTHVTEWTKWWLDIEVTQTRLTSCEERLEQIEDSVPTTWRSQPTPRDPNARITAALPQIATALRDGRKELHRHETAITRLSTIHEFGLTRTRERAAAVEARRSIATPESEGAEETHTADPLSGLADM